MRTKEEYYQSVLNHRKVLSNPENTACPCTKVKCEWHGKCRESMALHRFYSDHRPYCMQLLVRGAAEQLSRIAEMHIVDKEKTPHEYYDYVREQDCILNPGV